MRRRDGLADEARIRFGIALLIACVLWAALLTRIVNPLLRPSPNAAVSEQTVIEMRLVELAAPLAPAHAVAPAVAPQAHARRDPARVRLAPSHEIRSPAAEHAVAKDENPAKPAQPEADPTATSTAVEATSSASASDKTAPSAVSTARAISQPMPALPDDLREDAYQAVAVARFNIHADGTIEVELSKPTQNPRLNALLLEALRKWRFFPAMQGGHAVESHQDVRVHFNVS